MFMIVLALTCLVMVVSSLYLRWRVGEAVAHLLFSSVPLSILSLAAGIAGQFQDSTSLQWFDLHVGCAVIALLSLALDRQFCTDFLVTIFGLDRLGQRSEGHTQTFVERHFSLMDGVFRALVFVFLGEL